MDQKLLNQYDRECMRMAMIKHEETFKEQVSELHRLYRIQKMLMKNIRSNRPNIGRSQELSNLRNELGFIQNSNDHHQRDAEHKPQSWKLDLEQPAEDYIAEPDDGEGVLELIEESEIELTLGPSNYNRWKKPETPLTSDSGPSFSSSSTGSSQINRTSSWIHQMARDQLNGYELGLVKVPDMTSGYHSRSKNNIDVEEQQLRQERLNQAPWLFQVLSLNMT
ncbi:uncharacterized protein LOC121254025 [Juglans microcarpa x Juglans regia]|uniref:uncharacterized protein LOC121254025 n=1 Tax=Juglans microcarpa x Juglans regia TaxID=2249226 RepID=UPI001B7F1C7E|nr:uncharacterized protein LOC121254025 [Juglans microcarpa x Juglans regia]XP_041009932.1 uncharacterized protein LOC121254025 [Juglans microcarpa x Juglans regia]XP_041009939.1 uncharacterized protein LOC121254025 [Juglans microcarpa x Juglans regia]